ncbi:MAG: DUF2202 domain-containing protein [Ignavibacteria bacterium]|nr:DUF2202 domain-containing protein [Ignavibacteria bacterium]
MKNKHLISFLLFAVFYFVITMYNFSFSFAETHLKINYINDEEKRSLEYMTQEEKLARDYASQMGTKYNSDFFNKVAAEKQDDLDKIKDILKSKNVDDPVKNDEAGIYKSDTFKDIYTRLTDSGNLNVNEAFKGGAEIAELQIKDLNKYLTSVSDKDIKDNYTELKKNAEKNLKSYVNQLSQKGIGYFPKHITADDFNKILN